MPGKSWRSGSRPDLIEPHFPRPAGPLARSAGLLRAALRVTHERQQGHYSPSNQEPYLEAISDCAKFIF